MNRTAAFRWWSASDDAAADRLIIAMFVLMPCVKGAAETFLFFLTVYGLYLLARKKVSWQSVPSEIVLLAVCMACFALLKLFSMAWAIAPHLALRDFYSHGHFLAFLPLLAVFHPAKRPLDSMLTGMRIALPVVALWALANWLTAPPERPFFMLSFRAGAQNSGVLGDICAIYTLFLLISLFTHKPSARGNAYWTMLSIAAGGFALAASGARTALLAFSITSVLVLFWNLRHQRIKLLLSVTVLTLALGSVVFANKDRFALGFQQASDYLAGTPLQAEKENSIGFRLALYQTAYTALKAEPLRALIGYGAGNTRALTDKYAPAVLRERSLGHFHNQYLQLLSESGFLGLIAPLAMLAALLTMLTRNSGGTALAGLALFGYAFVCYEAVAGLTNNVTKHGLLHTMSISIFVVLTLSWWQGSTAARQARD